MAIENTRIKKNEIELLFLRCSFVFCSQNSYIYVHCDISVNPRHILKSSTAISTPGTFQSWTQFLNIFLNRIVNCNKFMKIKAHYR